MTRRYRLLLLAFPRRVRRDFGADMSQLFDAQLEAARAAGDGLTRFWVQAMADALVHGSAERIQSAGAQCRALVGALMQWRWWMRAWRHDLRQAIRAIVRQPGVSLLAVLTLALGIGANTAIFSAVDTVMLRTLPYEEPDRLVMVWEKRAAEGVFNNVVAPADFVDWARMSTVFESMAALDPVTADLTGGDEPQRLGTGAVTTRFFDVLRVRPEIGRTFRPEDGVVGQHRLVLLGYGLWQRQFGGDRSIVGRSIQLNGIPHDVIGVLPRTFEFPDPTLELWAPMPLEGLSEAPSRGNHYLYVYARMKRGVTVEQARAEMDRLGAQLSAQHPESNRRHGAWVSPLHDELVETIGPALWLLFGAVAFVLLIACVNVANLLLVRTAGRVREIAIRAALGAGRARLAGQLLTESLVLGLLGGAAGLVVAYWAIHALKQLVPENAPILGLAHIGLDLRVLGFALLVSLVTSALFGLLPAWHLARQDANVALQAGGPRSLGVVRRRLRLVLVVSEIALASLLLVAAGLALRSFQALVNVPAGFVADGKLTTAVVLRNVRYRDNATVLRTYDQIERRFASIPGVRAAGATNALPLSGQDARRGIEIQGGTPTPDVPTRAHIRAVTPSYLRAMDVQLAAGRAFTDSDREDAPPVAIINETMARRYWPGVSSIGRRVRMVGTPDWREVVGIVRDVRHWGFARPLNPELYLPLAQYTSSNLTFVLATERDPASMTGSLREVLRDVDPNLPLSTVRTMNEVAARSIASQRGVMLLLAVFAGTALVLAAAGIYGVMAHFVALRTAEIGLRLALGARPAALLKGILAEGAWQAVCGLALGLGGAVAVVRLFRGLLYGVQPTDLVTLLSVAALMLAAALLACLVPARRAMRVDPVTALRQ